MNSFLAVEALLIANSNALITDLQLLNANLLLTTCEGVREGGGCVIINQCLHGTKRVGLLHSKHECRKRFLDTGANIRMRRFQTCRTRNTHERPLMREGPTDSTTATTILPVINGWPRKRVLRDRVYTFSFFTFKMPYGRTVHA